ncbi:hypothetical protein SAMN02745194_00830 [Roseomonas rosea]|uniref:Uncharacterized protein n=1 Tax=Muricoccus roseus TaxID=198092 RepID=A0A1M6D672_9PROT|nr:hypothetical protein [Roseomonas rosea]SHI68641.1 hypothetical protein SAMN02745194_00830 [Roseomonas rosea]
MRTSELNLSGSSPRPWLGPWRSNEHISARSTLLAGLREAHASNQALVQGSAAWHRAGRAESLREEFLLLRREAEEALRRVEYVLAGLGRSARGARCWLRQGDLALAPGADDASLVALSTWAIGRISAGTLRLQHLAHECEEYQAARLLQMSVDGQLLSARRIAAAVRGGGAAAPALVREA